MSIRRTSIDRLNEARKSGRPTIAKGKPLNAQGDDGDLTFRRTSDGLKLYIKAAGKWNGVKVGESFDDLEKSLNNLQKIVSTIKKFRLPNKIVLDYDVVDAGAGKTSSSPLHIDYDRTGDVASGTDRNTALDIDLNVTGASGGTIYSTGAKIDVVGDSGGTSTARGLRIDVTGADTNEGIRIETPDGSADIVMMSPNNNDDYCSISVGAEGATTIATNDDDTGVGHLTLDVDGDIILDADGGEIELKDGGTTFGVFSTAVAVSRLRMYEDGGASGDDYFNIDVAANGATTLTTVDAAGANADLTMTVDGDFTVAATGIELQTTGSAITSLMKGSDTFARFEAHHSLSMLNIFENEGASMGDYFQIGVGEHGETTIFTADLAGAAAHLKFDIDGSFLIKESASAGADVSGYGQIWVKNENPNELWFRAEDGTDIQITDGSSIAGGGGTSYHYTMHNWYSGSGYIDYYIPWGGSVTDYNGITDPLIDDNTWIAPFTGKIVEARVYSDSDTGSTDLKLSRNGTLGSSLLSGGAVNCSSDKTVYTFTCDQNNTFSAGDVIRVFFDGTNHGNQVTFSIKWEIS